MPLDETKPLDKDKRTQARMDWEVKIKHTEPQAAWKGTIVDRGFSYKTADGKFVPGLRESASPDFEGLQLRLAAEGCTNVRLVYWVRFDPGYECPDQHKLVNTMAMAMLGWPVKFAVHQNVEVWNWRNESGYVQWGIKGNA